MPVLIQPKEENNRRKYFMIKSPQKIVADRWGSNLHLPDHQADAHPTEPPRPQGWRVKRDFVSWFYGSVNPMGSCRAQSVYLITLLMSRVVLYAVNPFCALSFTSNWQLPFLNHRKSRMTVENISGLNLSERMLPTRSWERYTHMHFSLFVHKNMLNTIHSTVFNQITCKRTFKQFLSLQITVCVLQSSSI